MNIHHLELFYYVARHGGITQAVRNIPYGIQQPAVSGQIAQLEEFLGASLFRRRPFSLTPAGKKLYQFIEPFFSGVDAVAAELQGGTLHQLRIGSAAIILRDHLPELLRTARKKFPGLKITLREGYQPQLEALLEQQEIDLAVTVLERKPPPGIRSRPLLELPLVLLVPRESSLTSANALWKRDRVREPLICLPATETVCKKFHQGLARLGLEWPPAIEVPSLDLIESYVAGGLGIGLTVAMPGTQISSRVRALPLPGFAPVPVGVLWRGKPTPSLQILLDEMQTRARCLRT